MRVSRKQINVRNVIAYAQGNVRYFLYYKPSLKFLIPVHIREQIEYRINSMNSECYASGNCVKCGCKTTALQMANKPCEGNCYPEMLNRKTWKFFRDTNFVVLADYKYFVLLT